MTASYDEFQSLVQIVCDQSSSSQARQNAEHRLTEIQNDDSSWEILLSFLSVTDDNLLFFIGQGLSGIAWRSFHNLSTQQQNSFSEVVTQTLTGRNDISTFARSKIEQVLAAICASTCTLQPVLSIVVDVTEPGFEVGLSALRTVFEEVLKDDARIPPDQQKALLEAASEVATPLSEMACRVCEMAAASNIDSSAVQQIALQLMRELVVKLPVGPHLSFQVLTALFGVVERYHQQQLEGVRVSGGNAVLAVEVLTEVMSKRYIPPATDGTSTDAGAGILVELVAQAVELLKALITSGRDLDDSETALPLLGFIQVFVESHMQRCIQTSERHENTRTVIEVFLEEFATMTKACTQPEHLLKVVAIWEGLLDIEAAKRVVVRNDSCLEAGFFIFHCGVVQKNEALIDLIEDFEEDIDTDPFTDQKVKDVLEHIIGRRKKEGTMSAQLRTDEGSSVGFALLQSINRCVSMFAESPAFTSTLAPVAQELLQETLEALSNGTGSPAVALDCVFLLRLVPLFMGPQDIIPSLLPVVSGMLQSRAYSRGKCFVYLFQSSCKFLDALMMSFVFQEFSPGDSAGPAIQQLVEYMCAVVEISCASCDVMISPPPLVVMGSGVVLLLQTMGLAESDRLKSLKETITEALGGGIKQLFDSTGDGMALPVEVGTLVFCAASHLYDNVVTTTCGQWLELVNEAKRLDEQGGEVWTTRSLGNIARYNSFLDALARYRSSSSPTVRQLLIEALSPISEAVDWVVSSLLQSAVRHVSARNGQATSSALMTAAASSVSLSQSMLQNLGKKHFFQQASSVLMLSHSLLCSQDVTGSDINEDVRTSLIFEGAGLDFTHQALSLTRSIASASSSAGATVSDQLEVTEQILAGVSVALNDKALCADLLEEVLRCGWTAVGCYWRGDNSKAGPLVSFLMQLFDACMDPSVPPHDALLSVEGPLSLNSSKKLFKSEWFRTNCWDNTIVSCLKVFLLGIHAAHHDTIALMLRQLLTSYSEAAATAEGVDGVSISFWPFVCGQILAIATDNGCGDQVEAILVETTDNLVHPMQQQGRDIDSIIDVLLVRLLRPIAALVSRCQNSASN